MKSVPCKNRNEFSQITNNPDGTISVYVTSPSTGQLVPYILTKPCCENIGGIFDVESQKCFYSKIMNGCDHTQPFNLVLNPKGNDGAIFSNIEDETCTLNIQFDYLFKFDCDKLSEFINGKTNSSCETLDEIFQNLGASVSIEKILQTQLGVTSVSVYEEPFFTPIGTGNLLDYLTQNSGNTGFYICQNNNFTTTCNELDLSDDVFLPWSNCVTFAEQMLIKYPTIPSNSFASNWLSFNTDITDPSILSGITNEKIKLVIKLSGFCIDMCVLVDNIRLNKICSKALKDEIFVTKSPGFELDRIIDNKKSWVKTTETTHREFSISKYDNTQPIRYTDYYLNDERQVLNTKEIDLDIDIAAAVETDVWCYISDNPCLLTGGTIGVTTCIKDVYSITGCSPQTYCCSEYCGDANIDIQGLLTQPLSSVTTIEDFEYYITSELIDTKNRQTINSYATLRLLYDRYMNSLAFCGSQSSKFDYYKMEQFANLIGNYWVDLIEQVIPATTIWGSTRVYTNTIFDKQKHKYKAYTSLFGVPAFENVLSPATGATCGVEIITSVITGDTNTLPQFNKQTYSTLYLTQMNSGSEFIGSVRILSPNTLPCSNDTITGCELEVRIEDNIAINGTLSAIASNYTGNVSYVWTTPVGEVIGSNVTYTVSGDYKVEITDDCCYATATITIM